MARLRTAPALLIALLFATVAPSLRAQDGTLQAQDEPPCGLVDELRDPLIPLGLRYDDFDMYRARFSGRHVGLDIGFGEGAGGRRVFAAARGQVTYADAQGWDSEGGVIVLAHHFPDGSLAYSLYGHIAPGGGSGAVFPEIGRCVEAGEPLARFAIPTLSAPHLHFEFRDFLPDDGGPGYVPGNPLEAGWFHPLDFAAAWRLRLNLPARAAYSSPAAPTLPPLLLPDGQLILASGRALLSVSPLPERRLNWRLQSDAPLTGLLALADGRVFASSGAGQALIVSDGRYRDIWSAAVAPRSLAPVIATDAAGEMLVFAGEDGALAAHDAAGELRWRMAGQTNARPLALSVSGRAIAFLREEAAGARLLLRALADGRMLGEWSLAGPALLAARPGGGWWLYDGAALQLLAETGGVWQLTAIATVGEENAPPRAAQLQALSDGGALLFSGGAEGALTAFGPGGERRWQRRYPALSPQNAPQIPPLLASAADGCWLAALAADGSLHFLRAGTGERLGEAGWPGALYDGGAQRQQPAARLLEWRGGTLLVGAGYLSALALAPVPPAAWGCAGDG